MAEKDNTLWYLDHEDYWCVKSALEEYRLMVLASDPTNKSLREKVDKRCNGLLSRLREVR